MASTNCAHTGDQSMCDQSLNNQSPHVVTEQTPSVKQTDTWNWMLTPQDGSRIEGDLHKPTPHDIFHMIPRPKFDRSAVACEAGVTFESMDQAVRAEHEIYSTNDTHKTRDSSERDILVRDELVHCEICQNDKIGSYRVIKKLGSGRFARVWSARAENASPLMISIAKVRADADISGGASTIRAGSADTPVAIKVYRTDDDVYYLEEIRIFNEINGGMGELHPNIVHALGTFIHMIMGPDHYPRIHPCIVFELSGNCLSTMLDHYYDTSTGTGGMPVHHIKTVMRELFSAIAFVHALGIIHTDIKPDNILTNQYTEVIGESTPELHIKLADFGSAVFVSTGGKEFPAGTYPYRSPEILIETSYGTPTDIWSAFILCFELFTGDNLLDADGVCEVYYGDATDMPGGPITQRSGAKTPITNESPTSTGGCIVSDIGINTGTACSHAIDEYAVPGMEFAEWAANQSCDSHTSHVRGINEGCTTNKTPLAETSDNNPPELVFYNGSSGDIFTVIMTQDDDPNTRAIPRIHLLRSQKNTQTLIGDICGGDLQSQRPDNNAMAVDAVAQDQADSHGSDGSDDSHGSRSSMSSDWSRNTEDRELEVQRLMYLTTKIFGLPPRDFVDSARVFYDSGGKFIGAPLIEFVTISELLDINYNTPQETRKELEAFLLTGLKYLPAERITAEEALKHAWLK